MSNGSAITQAHVLIYVKCHFERSEKPPSDSPTIVISSEARNLNDCHFEQSEKPQRLSFRAKQETSTIVIPSEARNLNDCHFEQSEKPLVISLKQSFRAKRGTSKDYHFERSEEPYKLKQK